MKVWMDGRVVDHADAAIPVNDHGLLYGDGVFEGIRAQGGRVVDLPLHLDRLRRSARAIYLPIEAVFSQVVFDTLLARGEPDAYVRLLVTRGSGRLGLDTGSCSGPRVLCLADRIQLFPAERVAAGLRLATATWRRPDPDSLEPRVKSLNYLNNVLNRHEASLRGADDALVLNRRGTVAEASAANVFTRVGDKLFTPPPTDGALEGLTRRRVLHLAPELGLHAAEQTLARYDLLAADEVFLTGTGAGVVSVKSLDGVRIGSEAHRSVVPDLQRGMDRYARQHGVPVPGLEVAA